MRFGSGLAHCEYQVGATEQRRIGLDTGHPGGDQPMHPG